MRIVEVATFTLCIMLASVIVGTVYAPYYASPVNATDIPLLTRNDTAINQPSTGYYDPLGVFFGFFERFVWALSVTYDLGGFLKFFIPDMPEVMRWAITAVVDTTYALGFVQFVLNRSFKQYE